MRRPSSLLALLLLALPSPVFAHLLGQRDLETLARDATVVVRAEVRAVSGQDTPDDPRRLELQVVSVLKGEASGVLRVRGEGHHAIRPPIGEQGLFFLAPSKDEPGALACIQGEAERWTLEPEEGEGADRIVSRLLAGPTHEELISAYVQAVAHPSRRLAAHGVQRLALAVREKRMSPAAWALLRTTIEDGRIADGARASLVTAVGAAMPDGWAETLARELPDSDTSTAVLQVL
ncbi:MAG: hypothetical protein ACK4N5_10275, partial [Myxococcales bacterium]